MSTLAPRRPFDAKAFVDQHAVTLSSAYSPAAPNGPFALDGRGAPFISTLLNLTPPLTRDEMQEVAAEWRRRLPPQVR